MDDLEIKRTVHKVKGHLRAVEAASLGVNNPSIVEWLISNEAADAAAAEYADHLSEFDRIQGREESHKAELWKVLKRISAIELHIRTNEEGLADIAEGIFAKAAWPAALS